MRNTFSVINLLLAGGISFNVVAADITDTYSTGDTLTSTHMDNIKSAVNDNNSRLNAVETQTQPLALGCSAGSAIQSIDAAGNVTCEVDDDTNSGGDITEVIAGSGLSGGGTNGSVTVSRASGRVSIGPHNFEPISNNGCIYAKSTYFYWRNISTNASCNASAAIVLPDGATLTAMGCLLFDNDAAASNSVRLVRMNLGTGNEETLLEMSTTTDATFLQILDEAIPALGFVQNTSYAYQVYWFSSAHDTTSVNSAAGIRGCSISYEYQ